MHVTEYCGRIRIIKDGVVLKEALSPQVAMDFLHIFLFERSINDYPQAAVLHAASLRRNGLRFLLVGTKGAGKTTLALQLVTLGCEFEGDEHVFVGGAKVIARPRGCRVKEGSLRYLPPAIAEISAKSASYQNYDGEKIYNINPQALCSSWRIEEGPVQCIFVLYPNHGGFSSIRPMQPSALLQSLIVETGVRDSDRGLVIAALAALASSTRGFDLSLGDHDNAMRCISATIGP